MTTENQKIITRMAPSPTGKFHVGGVRTALFNYLFARANNGEFILRSEDTDKDRSLPEHEKNMLDVFEWLGMDYDAFYRQSDRTELYKDHISKLVESGHAYEAEASKDNPDQAVIRFKNPNLKISFTDLILGEIEFDTTELGDFVIARNIETPIYHLTVVVDDGLMEVSHVIRGQEHINNTPRQILILEALGFKRPVYAHIPLIMSPRGGKLSKRDPEVIPALEYENLGILPESLINFLAFIGWNPGDEREIMSMQELVSEFSLQKVQKGGGVFNIEKLHWINKQYLNEYDDEQFVSYLAPIKGSIQALSGYNDEMFHSIIPVIKERTHSFADIKTMLSGGDLSYYFSQPKIDEQLIVWKKGTPADAVTHLTQIVDMINTYTGEWRKNDLKDYIFPYADEQGRGDVLWPLRFSLSGKQKSPDPFTLLEILGKDVSVNRIEHAVSEINKNL